MKAFSDRAEAEVRDFEESGGAPPVVETPPRGRKLAP